MPMGGIMGACMNGAPYVMVGGGAPGSPYLRGRVGTTVILTKSLQCSLEFNCVTLTLVFPAVFPH